MAAVLSLNEVKANIVSRLMEAGIEAQEAQRESHIIVEHATGYKAADQVLKSDEKLSKAQIELVEGVVVRRMERIPLQYSLGYAHFMGHKFVVRRGAFIPRCDTETLVVKTLELISQRHAKNPLHILEIGTGSGIIAISLLKALPALQVTGVEMAPRAFELTKENAQIHGVSDRLNLIAGDFEQVQLPQPFDGIVSNPPYIKPGTELQPEVERFEPPLALFGTDADGLGIYRKLAVWAKDKLKPNGFISLEVGDGQASDVVSIFEKAQWCDIKAHADLNKIDRVIMACSPH
jgi:release factor glutamine methyltransferase